MRYTASDETQICLANGEMLQLQYQKIDNTSNLYLVCFYNLHRLEERINPTIFRSVLTCMLIIVLMISLIIYVWANTKNASKMIEKLAYTDNVTGEKNRNYFKERATEILYAYPETPFLMNQFDIVHFSYVNESY